MKNACRFDVRHMPQGCGTWPAAWETDEGAWPTNGEIDILEGANDRGPNAATLHTGPGCSMPDSRPMFGYVLVSCKNTNTKLIHSQGVQAERMRRRCQ